MNKDLHFWTVKFWMNESGQGRNAFTLWASPKFIEAAKRAMAEMDEEQAQARAHAIIAATARGDTYSKYHRWLQFRPAVGLAHISVPGDACGIDLDFKDEAMYSSVGCQFLPHNVDTPDQQSTLFAIWLWWAHFVELYAEV